jgi:hypothetical protein
MPSESPLPYNPVNPTTFMRRSNKGPYFGTPLSPVVLGSFASRPSVDGARNVDVIGEGHTEDRRCRFALRQKVLARSSHVASPQVEVGLVAILLLPRQHRRFSGDVAFKWEIDCGKSSLLPA